MAENGCTYEYSPLFSLVGGVLGGVCVSALFSAVFFIFFIFLSALKRFFSFSRTPQYFSRFLLVLLENCRFFQVRKITFFCYLTKQIPHFFLFFYPFYPSNPFNRYFCGRCCGYYCGYCWFFSLKRLVFLDFYPLSILPNLTVFCQIFFLFLLKTVFIFLFYPLGILMFFTSFSILFILFILLLLWLFLVFFSEKACFFRFLPPQYFADF